MTLTRLLAVLAAFDMVVAFAMATLLPPTMSLADLIAMANANWLMEAHEFIVRQASPWIWLHMVLPFLVRPCWLTPTFAGILFAGGAMTLANRSSVSRSHRRRS